MDRFKKYFEKKTIKINLLEGDRWGLNSFVLSVNEKRKKAWINNNIFNDLTKSSSYDSLFGWDYYGGDNIHSGTPFIRTFNLHHNNESSFIVIGIEDEYGYTIYSNFITKIEVERLIRFIKDIKVKIS